MNAKLEAWCQFFRLPNLPTAPGDALAGAALIAGGFPEMFGGRPLSALAAGGAAFFFYLFGLADNDIVGAASDAALAPERPIPRGALSLGAARVARALCLLSAFLCGAAAHLPFVWWGIAGMLVGTILWYNRRKSALLMGASRALSLICGGVALVPAGTPLRCLVVMCAGDPGVTLIVAWCVLVLAALGWALYIAAVTKLSEGEDKASEGLGNRRYLLGLSAFVPLAAVALVVAYRLQLPDPKLTPAFLLLPIFGCLWTFATWCAAVSPLWMAHGPAERRRAVGQTIGALLYLQIGFMLVAPDRLFVLLAVIVWFAARTIRRKAPHISGS